jgi:hypothetical protein
MTETVLFVGGSMDGQKKIFCKVPHTFSIPVSQGPPPTWVGDNSKCYIVREDYHREILYYGEKEYPVFLISTKPAEHLIPLLIEGYRAKG